MGAPFKSTVGGGHSREAAAEPGADVAPEGAMTAVGSTAVGIGLAGVSPLLEWQPVASTALSASPRRMKTVNPIDLHGAPAQGFVPAARAEGEREQPRTLRWSEQRELRRRD